MRHASASALRFFRFLPAAATLLVIACKDTAAPPSVPVKLAFTVQPSLAIGSVPIPAFKVALQDAAGNTVTGATNTINLSMLPNQFSATLSGTTSVAAVNGVATFSDVTISTLGGGYIIVATSATLPAAISNQFNVTFGPASKLAFSGQPLTTVAGATLSPVRVTVQDAGGNTVTSANNSITLALGSNPGSATLSGTTTATAINGVASFGNLSLNNLGTGYTLTAAATNVSGATSTAFNIRTPLTFAMIAPGYFHSCGLTTGGAAYCWGANYSGQLGAPGTSEMPVPVEVASGINFASVTAGRDHSCGVNTGAAAYCWGDNSRGQLGASSATGVPGSVTGNRTFSAVSAGYAHSCGVTTAGAGYCWGDNSRGELGNGSGISANAPVAVSGTLTFASISPGRNFSCGRTTTNAAYCWGDNFYGELGDGTNIERTAPAAVSGGLSFAIVSAGGFHACGLTTAGLAYCWGWGDEGSLGNGTLISSNTPVAVSGNITFATLSAGNRHTCGVTPGGAAYCWGENSTGHLGNGTSIRSSVPVAVSGGYTFSSVNAGRFHTCGVTTSGAGYCWGTGFLGNGSTVSLAPVPVR